jgi:hypothetical protein
MAEEAKTGLEKEALDRRRDAKSWKEKFVLDFKECYFFASPSRQRQISSDTQPPNTPMLDQAELQTSVAMLNGRISSPRRSTPTCRKRSHGASAAAACS